MMELLWSWGMAEKWGVWGITNKVFFDPSKNTVFWQILKSD
jgi:hypothetical protein